MLMSNVLINERYMILFPEAVISSVKGIKVNCTELWLE